MAQTWHCCSCGCRPPATAPIQPLAWEPPFAEGVALKDKKKKKRKEKKTWYFKLRNLAVFCVWEDARVWAYFLWYATQLTGATIRCFFFHPESPQGALWAWAGGWLQHRLLDGRQFVSTQSSPRAHLWAAVMWWLDGCNILCLLIWQVTFFSSTMVWHLQKPGKSWK